VCDLHAISSLLQPFGDVFSDHHRAVLPAGASERNCQIAFALVNVMRQKINQKLRNSLYKFGSLRKRADVFCDFWMQAREWSEFRDEVRIWKKSNIEYKIGIFRNTMLESKTYSGDKNLSETTQ
jgi:hypothetical protein